MQIVCALTVLVATLAMLGVPKDHGGPRTKSHSCKRPAKNFGAHFWAHQSHSHNKPHKCDAVFHGKQGGAGGAEGGRYASKATKRKKKEQWIIKALTSCLALPSGCSGVKNLRVLLQFEETFDPLVPCIFLAPALKPSLRSQLPSWAWQYVICLLCWSKQGCEAKGEEESALFFFCSLNSWTLLCYSPL